MVVAEAGMRILVVVVQQEAHMEEVVGTSQDIYAWHVRSYNQ